MKYVRIILLAFFVTASCISSGTLAVSASENTFQGKIAVNIKDSVPHWMHEPLKAPPGAPNILLIILDDVGFGDAATFGGPAQTPALDRLAANGLRYNQFHTAGLCGPTRAALLSGRNHHHMGFGSLGGLGFPGYDGVWKDSMASVAEILRMHGYSTAAFGKWHNTPLWEITPSGPFERWPTGLGFQYYYGNLIGMSSQWEPSLWRNTVPVQQPKTPEQGYHFTTDITDEAIGWIRSHQSTAPDNPYFVYFATGAAHTPHHVPREWIEKYRGRFDQGWDNLRKEIFARQKQLGIIPASTELTSRPDGLPAWDSLSADERRLFARQMEIYAAFISHTDHEVGRLLQAAQEGEGGENTLILYVVGDNGGATEPGLTGSDGVSTAVQDQLAHLDELGSRQYYNMYAPGWAWAGNTPFQWVKGIASHFGGTRNPLVVSWPARIKDHGGLRTQFTHVVDVASTLYEVVGIVPPRTVKGVAQEYLDGISFAYSFDRKDEPGRRRTQYFEVEGNRAIYDGGWVAAARLRLPWSDEQNSDVSRSRWELYHVAEDFSQAHDIAAQHPEKLRELQALFDVEARKNNVYPLGANRFEPRLPSWQQSRREFIYHSGFPGLPLYSGAVPNFLQAPHRITADVEIPTAGAEGVIIAGGGRLGGFTLYAKDNRLVYESKVPGGDSEKAISTEPLPSGTANLAVELGAASSLKGPVEVRLYINGRSVGEARLSRVPQLDWFDNFDIGQDSASPVSDTYEPPFPFSGLLNRVHIQRK